MGFNPTKSNQQWPLPWHEFLLPSSWISFNSAVYFHCRVCTLHKKYFGLGYCHWRCRFHHWSHIYLRECHTMCFQSLANFLFEPQFLTDLQLLRWEGDHAHVCFWGTCFFIYSLHTAPYHPFNNRLDKKFNLPVLWLYPCFHNSVQLQWNVFLITKYWAKACRLHDNNWQIYCCFYLFLHSVKLKNFSLWLGSA